MNVEELIVKQVEKEIDSALEAVDNLNDVELEKIRKQRLQSLKKQYEQKQIWEQKGHGTFSELMRESEIFDLFKQHDRIVCHFYDARSYASEQTDKFLSSIAKKHLETKFVRINSDKCPFLKERLNVKKFPAVAIIIDAVIKGYIYGLSKSCESLEWELESAGAIFLDHESLEKKAMHDLALKNKTRSIRNSNLFTRSVNESDSD